MQIATRASRLRERGRHGTSAGGREPRDRPSIDPTAPLRPRARSPSRQHQLDLEALRALDRRQVHQRDEPASVRARRGGGSMAPSRS